MGHSTGLLLVGVVLIVRDSTRNENGSGVINMPDALSHFFESIVGIFMLFLGVYGFRRALQKRHEFEGRVAIPCGHDDGDEAESMQILEKGLGYGDVPAYLDFPHHRHESQLHAANGMAVAALPGNPSSLQLEATNAVVSDTSSHGLGQLMDSGRQFSVRTIAVLAGIIHGLAGPGGVLAVIPAVQLHDWILATIYLSCFCVSSTLTMGCFACFYGSCSRGVGRRTQLEFQIHLFSASLSIIVGITWLVLLGMGKLEEVFP
jgi:hypothetical protein